MASFAASKLSYSEHQDNGDAGILAGLAGSSHYRARMSPVRYKMRSVLLPWIQKETPILAKLQKRCRNTPMDFWFVYSANLGGHTAFLTILPILFWFFGAKEPHAFVDILAAGVFFSSMVKDWFCLPRPLSPPLHRLNMSGSTGLEYGFLSSHSTNAVSVAYYCLALISESPSLAGNRKIVLQLGVWLYLVTIVFGRLYCGMHGFLDIGFGSVLGYTIAKVRHVYGDELVTWMNSSTLTGIFWLVITIVFLVLVFPQPADPCPCFDDGVAFAGVVIGINISFYLGRTLHLVADGQGAATVTTDLSKMSWFGIVLRTVLGVSLVLGWRAIAKPILLQALPPLYRGLGRLGVVLPRRGFASALLYSRVPKDLPDEFLPDVRRIPQAVAGAFSKRARSDSVGPQSAADVHAQVELRSRVAAAARKASADQASAEYPVSGSRPVRPGQGRPRAHSNLRQSATPFIESDEEDFIHDMAESDSKRDLLAAHAEAQDTASGSEGRAGLPAEGEATEEETALIQRPRMRFDVEVSTKLVVYAGVGFTAVTVVPFVSLHLLGDPAAGNAWI
ncbi:Long-chain base-1-phosphate phosphatase [Savitreella phatthalungensis]